MLEIKKIDRAALDFMTALHDHYNREKENLKVRRSEREKVEIQRLQKEKISQKKAEQIVVRYWRGPSSQSLNPKSKKRDE